MHGIDGGFVSQACIEITPSFGGPVEE